jgi:WD40 repeat protein
MFSGSADGSIAVWMAGGGWEHLKLLKGHKGWVNSLAVHPSGRLALSVAHDKALRMWNLFKGRCTYTAPLEEEAQLVAFSPSGQVGVGVGGGGAPLNLSVVCKSRGHQHEVCIGVNWQVHLLGWHGCCVLLMQLSEALVAFGS